MSPQTSKFDYAPTFTTTNSNNSMGVYTIVHLYSGNCKKTYPGLYPRDFKFQ